MKLNKESFYIDGGSITWEAGVATFHKYGTGIKVEHDKFTLEWAEVMNRKLKSIQPLL